LTTNRTADACLAGSRRSRVEVPRLIPAYTRLVACLSVDPLALLRQKRTGHVLGAQTARPVAPMSVTTGVRGQQHNYCSLIGPHQSRPVFVALSSAQFCRSSGGQVRRKEQIRQQKYVSKGNWIAASVGIWQNIHGQTRVLLTAPCSEDPLGVFRDAMLLYDVTVRLMSQVCSELRLDGRCLRNDRSQH
jgi:hypothetical protein